MRGIGAGGGEQLKEYPPEAGPAVISPQQTEGVGYVELIARASYVALGRWGSNTAWAILGLP